MENRTHLPVFFNKISFKNIPPSKLYPLFVLCHLVSSEQLHPIQPNSLMRSSLLGSSSEATRKIQSQTKSVHSFSKNCSTLSTMSEEMTNIYDECIALFPDAQTQTADLIQCISDGNQEVRGAKSSCIQLSNEFNPHLTLVISLSLTYFSGPRQKLLV